LNRPETPTCDERSADRTKMVPKND